MIRINLIQKKQPSYVSAATKSAEGGASGSSFLDNFRNLSSGGLAGFVPILKSMGIPIVIGLLANFGYDYYVEQRTTEMTQEVTKLDEEKIKINKELTKIKGFETVKVELERNELVLRTKIDTIEKLIRSRDYTIKSLVTLAQAMPRDIWMTSVVVTESAYELNGGTVDLSLVSDFMSKLGQSIYFRDVTLKNSSSDPSGTQANFALTARRE